MIIRELIEKLQGFPDDAEVVLEDDLKETFSIDSIGIVENKVLIKLEGDNDERNRLEEAEEE
ncbi:MAG: hypothetical protein V7K89_09445 [Nostoc sp.]|uniref:hypothetical protein n=1 Tax=Nostoc sp. TaxID=1180 RepID=UPI002FF5DC1F